MAKGNLIINHVNRFLQQQSDHKWLIKEDTGGGGQDHFTDTVVYSTFPSTLTSIDFGNYIDLTFSDLPKDLKIKMKGLYIVNSQSFQQEDIVFNYEVDGQISATLIQIIAQKNQSKELEMLVGFISLTRIPTKNWRFNNKYWQSDKDRVKRGLQYIFGNVAQKELPKE